MDSPPFLETLGADSLAALRRSWLVKRWARGETILHHGDPGSDVYVVLDGIARASVASEEGKTVAYTEFVAGDIFGEFSAIDQGPRSADVVAWTDMSIGRLPAAAFAQLVERDAGFTWALLRHFTRISRTQNRRVFEFSTMLVRERLVQELLRLARLGTGPTAGSRSRPPPPTRTSPPGSAHIARPSRAR